MKGVRGYALATFSTFTAALTAVLAKAMLTDSNPLALNAVIYTSAFALSAIYLILKGGRMYVSKKSILSGICLSLYGALLYYSFTTIKVSVGGLAISLFPVFTSALAPLTGERLGLRETIAVLLSSASLISISFVSDPKGLALAVLASLSLSAYTLLLKGEPLESFYSVLLASSLASWLFVILANVQVNYSALSASALGLLSFLGTLAWVWAVNEIGASRSSVTALSYPLFVLVLSVTLLGEGVNAIEVMAYLLATLSLASVILDGLHVKGK